MVKLATFCGGLEGIINSTSKGMNATPLGDVYACKFLRYGDLLKGIEQTRADFGVKLEF